MSFNSIEFFVFLPIVFGLYWSLSNNRKGQNALIVCASYIFYGWWDWRFLLLIAFTTICSYYSGIFIERNHTIWQRKAIVIISILSNLLVLSICKYFNFFTLSLTSALHDIGISFHPLLLNIVLPVGISFYTFQALSYTIDIYRGRMQTCHEIIGFFAFISFFPQLVAGPIERATNLLPQFLHPRKFEYPIAVDGSKQILWGLFKKVVVADNCADIVDAIWQNYESQSSFVLIVTAILFTFQIYGDFSGYSDIAIGTAKLFGIKLKRNFNVPYFSRSVAEFWKRWHISLNTWFVDYVYIPLGGSREGKYKTFRNVMTIFLLSGLWHGANWTYICWGGYHAILFLPLILTNRNKRYCHIVAEGRFFPTFKEFFSMLVTFLLVVIGWIIFRSDSINEFWNYMLCIFKNIDYATSFPYPPKIFYFIPFMLIIEWLNRSKAHPFAFQINNRSLRWGFYLVLILLCITQGGKQTQFIYFQF